jgi:hypothetical protein
MENTIKLVDRLAFQSTLRDKILKGNAVDGYIIAKNRRKGGEYSPLVWDDVRGKSGIYRAFLADWDGDCRTNLMYSLIGAGFTEVEYEAPYFWKYENDFALVEYIEGDLYIIPKK